VSKTGDKAMVSSPNHWFLIGQRYLRSVVIGKEKKSVQVFLVFKFSLFITIRIVSDQELTLETQVVICKCASTGICSSKSYSVCVLPLVQNYLYISQGFCHRVLN
jgi:hypothetical protein